MWPFHKKSKRTPVDSAGGKPSGRNTAHMLPLSYRSFDEQMHDLHERPSHRENQEASIPRAGRTAVVVVHGMGSQKPYETLDQFARGVRANFGAAATQEILLRQHPSDANTSQKDWTQAYVRVKPTLTDPRIVDLYEYYWAPVITDKVSAVQSLSFLIATGLTPFRYLSDNLTVIEDASALARVSFTGFARTRWMFFSLVRELSRMLFIYIPLIALALTLYSLVAQPVLNRFIPDPRSRNPIDAFLSSPPLTFGHGVELAELAIRLLLIGTCIRFLAQNLGNRQRSATAYSIMVSFLLAFLLALTFLHARLLASVTCLANTIQSKSLTWDTLAVLAVVVVLLTSSIAVSFTRLAWKRAVEYIRNHPARIFTRLPFLVALVVLVLLGAPRQWPVWLQFPDYVLWNKVAHYVGLAALVYACNAFLTSAIGGLAVYLGADALSKNNAARNQILDECTSGLITLVAGRDAEGKPQDSLRYDRVLIAAHSLGSVISFDTLNELLVRKLANDPTLAQVPLDRIQGLLTFGCPLNKVVYFFRSRTSLQTNVLTKILYLLHPFRLRTPLHRDVNPPVRVPHPVPNPFGANFTWLNAYSPFDLISGRMLFYQADKDIPVESGVMPWTAHTSYWENEQLYKVFAQLL